MKHIISILLSGLILFVGAAELLADEAEDIRKFVIVDDSTVTMTVPGSDGNEVSVSTSNSCQITSNVNLAGALCCFKAAASSSNACIRVGPAQGASCPTGTVVDEDAQCGDGCDKFQGALASVEASVKDENKRYSTFDAYMVRSCASLGGTQSGLSCNVPCSPGGRIEFWAKTSIEQWRDWTGCDGGTTSADKCIKSCPASLGGKASVAANYKKPAPPPPPSCVANDQRANGKACCYVKNPCSDGYCRATCSNNPPPDDTCGCKLIGQGPQYCIARNRACVIGEEQCGYQLRSACNPPPDCLQSGSSGTKACCSGLQKCDDNVCRSSCPVQCTGQNANAGTRSCCAGLQKCADNVCRSSCPIQCAGQNVNAERGNCCSGLRKCADNVCRPSCPVQCAGLNANAGTGNCCSGLQKCADRVCRSSCSVGCTQYRYRDSCFGRRDACLCAPYDSCWKSTGNRC